MQLLLKITQVQCQQLVGNLEPGHRADGRPAGLEEPCAPERPREQVAEFERHLPHRHAHRCRSGD